LYWFFRTRTSVVISYTMRYDQLGLPATTFTRIPTRR
jgi:hypothetical protein